MQTPASPKVIDSIARHDWNDCILYYLPALCDALRTQLKERLLLNLYCWGATRECAWKAVSMGLLGDSSGLNWICCAHVLHFGRNVCCRGQKTKTTWQSGLVQRPGPQIMHCMLT